MFIYINLNILFHCLIFCFEDWDWLNPQSPLENKYYLLKLNLKLFKKYIKLFLLNYII